MRRLLVFFAFFLFVSSCDKEYDSAFNSADRVLMKKTADKYYEKKNWSKALALYEKLPNLVFGTEDAPEVLFKTAYANYYYKNYRLAGYLFKNFYTTHYSDSRREEAAYMSAFCYYKSSPDYNLDQSTTLKAINELQNFLNSYPNSERSENIDKMIDELSYKLEFKAFESALQYYKMSQYKSAGVAFENMLNDFPSTKFRPKIYGYMMKSRRNLALQSVHDLKKDRISYAVAFAKQVQRDYPDTEYAKEAKEIIIEMEREDRRFSELTEKAESEKRQTENKRKRLEGKIDEKETLPVDSTVSKKSLPSANFRIPRG